MIIHNINPVLLNLGAVQIRYYGLIYVIGFIAAFFVLKNLARNKKIKNLDEENIYDLMLYLMAGMLVGSRIFYFTFYSFGTLLSDPLEIFRIWHGGMSFHGALVGMILATYLFCKKYKVKFYDIADMIVIPAAIALFFGRIANFVNGELWGTKTTVSWCIDYTHSQYIQNPPDGCRHPSQIYEALKNLGIFFVLLYLHTKKKLKEGTMFWLFVTMYGGLRFIITFWRDDPRFLGISTGQYLSLIMFIAGIIFLYRIHHKKNNQKTITISTLKSSCSRICEYNNQRRELFLCRIFQ